MKLERSPDDLPAVPQRSDPATQVIKFPGKVARKQELRSRSWDTLRKVGPAIVTGAADLDPSAIVTATVIGAAFSFQLLWVVLLCVPFLLAALDVSTRIGIETRKGIFDLIRENYGRTAAACGAGVTLVISMVVIVADLMAVSDVLSIILHQPRMFFVPLIAFSVWYMLVFHDYRKITRVLVWFSLPVCLYLLAAGFTTPSIRQLLSGFFVPHLHGRDYIEGIVALFGSLLTPYIVLWQTSSRTDHGHEHHRADSIIATIVTFVLAASIIIAAGSVLHLAHPLDMSTRDAAEALRPAVGEWGMFIFSLGIIGAGMVALPVLVASMCYDVTQALGWKYGLSQHPWEAKRFYLLISGTMFLAVVGNFFRINPVTALYWSMILAGILLIPTLIFIMFVSNHRGIMRTTNTLWQNILLGAATGTTAVVGIVYLWEKFR
ncbi:MAG: divalent metal cation transporter [Acidobacteriaceae bacterium]|nr:divalent metal cation transporter [Acidobacteriaceae bacterium]